MRKLRQLALFVPAILLTGCGTGIVQNGPDSPTPPLTTTVAMQGNIRGGKLPIKNAQIQLYQAGTTGYGMGAKGLIANGGIYSDSNGGFSLTGQYDCDKGSMVYLVAVGGDTGSGANPSSVLVSGLGRCESLSANTSISINEVTTVATVWALAPFMNSGAKSASFVNESGATDNSVVNIGAPPTNGNGLANAFADINTLVNTSNGTAPGNLPVGASVSTSRINAIADALAECVNSTGPGVSTTCSRIFALTKSRSGVVPGDTLSAALNMARNPAQNVGGILQTISSSAPFQPFAQSAHDLTLSVSYTRSTLNAPAALAIDSVGNVWIANANSLSEMSHTGGVISPASGFANNLVQNPTAIALDHTGNIWVANAGTNSLAAVTPSGNDLPGSPFVGGGLSSPSALTFDMNGNIWATNPNNSTISEFSATGSPLSPPTGFASPSLQAPLSIAAIPF